MIFLLIVETFNAEVWNPRIDVFFVVTKDAFVVAATEDERKNADEFFNEASDALFFKDPWNAAVQSSSLRYCSILTFRKNVDVMGQWHREKSNPSWKHLHCWRHNEPRPHNYVLPSPQGRQKHYNLLPPV